MRNMKELQDVIVMLGLNIDLCLKYKKATGPFRSDVVKEEVLDLEDTTKEVEVQNVCDKLVQKKSTVAKMSSSRGKYRQSRMMKEFKKKMKKSLLGEYENGEDSFNELEAHCSAQTPNKRVDIQALKMSASGKLMKSGLLKDFEVKVVKSANEGTLKKSASKEERSYMCNTCGVKFAKYPSLRRHCRENHGIQDEMPGTEVVKPSVKKCPKCDLKFKFRSSLSRHLKRVHINESKQIDSGKELHHKCGECDKMFSNFHMLRRHRKDQHSKMIVKPGLQGITSVSCQDCGLVLTSMNDMIQHSQEVHKRIVESIENVKMEVLHKDNSSKRIKCSDCDKSFNQMSDMRKHVESYHEGKTYGCGECDAIFSYKHNANRHCVIKGHDKELIYMVVDLP